MSTSTTLSGQVTLWRKGADEPRFEGVLPIEVTDHSDGPYSKTVETEIRFSFEEKKCSYDLTSAIY